MITHFGGVTKVEAVKLAAALRAAGITTWLAFARDGRSMKSQMREADKRDVRFALILGEEELAQHTVAVRPMGIGQQETIARAELIAWLQAKLSDSPGGS
jgi:histidyl-tRNA synthetase